MLLKVCNACKAFRKQHFHYTWDIERLSSDFCQTEFPDPDDHAILWTLSYNRRTTELCIRTNTLKYHSIFAEIKLEINTDKYSTNWEYIDAHFSPSNMSCSVFFNKECIEKDDIIEEVTAKIFVSNKLVAAHQRAHFISESNLSSFTRAMQSLVDDGTHSDVTLVSLKGGKVHAHKAILAARSPVFSAMFSHDMREQLTGIVNIAELDYITMKDFVTFIYTGTLPPITDLDIMSKLIIAADKYAIYSLKALLEDLFSEKISKSNAIELLVLSQQCNSDILITAVTKYLIENRCEELYETEEWKSMLSNYPWIGTALNEFGNFSPKKINECGNDIAK